MRLDFILLALLVFSTPSIAGPLYANDFESGNTAGWSFGSVSNAPNGSTKFLGEFARNESTILTMSGLPVGWILDFGLDLYINKSWDGNNTAFGPDIFTIDIVGGPALLQTTFSNTLQFPGFDQSYPAAWNAGSPNTNPPASGAIATNTLGYVALGSDFGNSTYRLQFLVPITTSTMQFRFAGLNLQDKPDENWGIDNVLVDVVAPEPSSGVFIALGVGLLALRLRRTV